MVIVPLRTMGPLSASALLDGTEQTVNMVRERKSMKLDCYFSIFLFLLLEHILLSNFVFERPPFHFFFFSNLIKKSKFVEAISCPTYNTVVKVIATSFCC